jgi:hypothetical protein
VPAAAAITKSDVESVKDGSLALLDAVQALPERPDDPTYTAQRQVAYEKARDWATIAMSVLTKVKSYFAAHRGEAIRQQEIEILVDLLMQLRDDYLRLIVQEGSALTRYHEGYRQAAELDQDEEFWLSWNPLFLNADAYREGAAAKPPAGLERMEFEKKRREWSAEIREMLSKFYKRFSAFLRAIIELPPP